MRANRTEYLFSVNAHTPPTIFGVYVFVLAQLAAGIGYRQCDTARIAGAWVDDHQRVSIAAAMGAFWFRHG